MRMRGGHGHPCTMQTPCATVRRCVWPPELPGAAGVREHRHSHPGGRVRRDEEPRSGTRGDLESPPANEAREPPEQVASRRVRS